MEDYITNREIGAALQELSEVRHDFRNLRLTVNLLAEEQERMKLDHARLKTRITTIVAAGVVLFSVIGWLLEFLTTNSL